MRKYTKYTLATLFLVTTLICVMSASLCEMLDHFHLIQRRLDTLPGQPPDDVMLLSYWMGIHGAMLMMFWVFSVYLVRKMFT